MGVFELQDVYVLAGVFSQLVLILLAFGGSTTLLEGLRAYFPSDTKPTAPNGPPAEEGRSATSGAARRRQKRDAGSTDSPAAEGLRSLVTYPLTANWFKKAEGVKDFENLMMLGQLSFTAALMGESLTVVFELPRSSLTLMMPLVALVGVPYVLVKAELLAGYLGKNEKTTLLGFALFGLIIGILLLFIAPTGIVDVDLPAGAASLSTALTTVAQARIKDIQPIVITPLHMQLPLLLSSLLAGPLCFLTAARLGRALYLALYPPRWGEDYVKVGLLAQAGMLLQYFLPLATCLLWAEPVTAYANVEGRQLPIIRAGALMACAVLQLLLSRSYLQTYLSSSMVTWYRVGNSHLASENPETAAQLVRTRLQMQIYLLPKTATEVCAPAVLWSSMSLILLTSFLYDLELTVAGKASSHPVYLAIPAAVAITNYGAFLTTGLHWLLNTMCVCLLQLGYMQAT